MTRYSSNYELAHGWANNLSSSGRNGNGSLSFSGNVIYSYSTPIAEFIEGENTVLFNTKQYSSTTTSHQSIINRAIPYSFDIIEIPFDCYKDYYSDFHNLKGHHSNFGAWENYLIDLYNKIKRARSKKEEYLKEAEIIKSQIQKYYNIFVSQIDKRKLSKNIRNIINQNFSADDLANLQEERARLAKLKIKREELKRKKQIEEQIQKFYNHQANQVNSQKVYLRLSKSKKWVETSARAKVPLRIALKLFSLALKMKKAKQELNISSLNEEQRKVWKFQLDKIDGKGNITVGCHFLEFFEMNRLYQQVILIKQALN